MKRFLSLFGQDALLAYRNGHVLITAILLAIMLAVVLLSPRRVEYHTELIYDASPGQILNAYLRAQGLPEDMMFTDRAAFETALAQQPTKVGVLFSGDIHAPHVEIVTRNVVSDENIRLLQTSLDSAIAALRGQAPSLPMRLLGPIAPPIPFNLNLIPIMLIFEVVLLGFLIAAVMVFQEKQAGTLRAYRVTPARTLTYIVSKTVLFSLFSLIYGGILLGVAFGLSIDYALIGLLLVLSSALMTMASLAISAFFRNLSEWFFPGVAILILNALPMISYGLPSFAPTWLTWIPSYPAMFAARAILFHGASLGQVAPTLIYLAALNLAALLASFLAVRCKLMKEGHA